MTFPQLGIGIDTGGTFTDIVLFDFALGKVLRKWLFNPADGDVANAIGAAASSFVLRETFTVEPMLRGGVEVFDHQGKTPFPTLKEGLAHARSQLKEQLTARARELGLTGVKLEWREEIIEDYAEFSRRTRKELIIARLEAILTGMPG